MPNVAVRRKRQIYPTSPTLPNRGIEFTEADVERILLSFGRRTRTERRATRITEDYGLKDLNNAVLHVNQPTG